MNYVAELQSAIDDYEDLNRRLREASIRLDNDPENEDLINEERNLRVETEEARKKLRSTYLTAMKAVRDPQNPANDDRDLSSRLSDMYSPYTGGNRRVYGSDRQTSVVDSKDSDSANKNEEANSNNIGPLRSENNNDNISTDDIENIDISDKDKDNLNTIANELINKYGFNKDDMSDGKFVQNTNIPMPRYRRNNETDKDYENFLDKYYKAAFEAYRNERDNKRYDHLLEDNHEDRLALPGKPDNKPDNQLELSSIEKPVVVEEDKKVKDTIPDNHYKKGLINIINDLTKGLNLENKKVGDRFYASNIKVSDSFKKSINTGNYLYNIVGAIPGAIKSVGQWLNKCWSKFRLSNKEKEDMEELRNRVKNLSDEELETIWKEYRGTRILQERFPSAVNNVLRERMREYGMDKVKNLNSENLGLYQKIYDDALEVQKINDRLSNPDITEAEKKVFNMRKANLLGGKVKEINKVYSNYDEANMILDSGLHGFDEDIKAERTNLNVVGMRFAKREGLDASELEEEARIERERDEALARNDAEGALNGFLEMNDFLNEHTKTESSIYGERSAGTKVFTPLVRALDYNDDPFIRNLATTVTTVLAGVSAFNAYHTHVLESRKVLGDERSKADAVNNANVNTINDVHAKGSDIAGRRDSFREGVSEQMYRDNLNFENLNERFHLDLGANKDGSWLGESYDSFSHHIENSNVFQNSIGTLKDIGQRYTAQSINSTQALNETVQAYSNLSSDLVRKATESYNALRPYAQVHPEYDLQPSLDALQEMINNPTATVNAFNDMLHVTEVGEQLTQTTATLVEPLSKLPSDMFTTLTGDLALAAKAADSYKLETHKNKATDPIIGIINKYNMKKKEASNVKDSGQRHNTI